MQIAELASEHSVHGWDSIFRTFWTRFPFHCCVFALPIKFLLLFAIRKVRRFVWAKLQSLRIRLERKWSNSRCSTEICFASLAFSFICLLVSIQFSVSLLPFSGRPYRVCSRSTHGCARFTLQTFAHNRVRNICTAARLNNRNLQLFKWTTAERSASTQCERSRSANAILAPMLSLFIRMAK